jgi:hypothetical protein
VTKYFPNSAIEANHTLDAEQVNAELRAAFGIVNGQLDRENIPHDVIGSSKLVADSINGFDLVQSNTATTYNNGDVGRGWFTIPVTHLDVTTSEGMLRGCFTGTIRRFPADNAENFFWRVGIFVDDQLVAETDCIYMYMMGLNLSFAIPITPGAHTVDVAFKGYVFAATIGSASPDDVFVVDDWQVWSRNARR